MLLLLRSLLESTGSSLNRTQAKDTLAAVGAVLVAGAIASSGLADTSAAAGTVFVHTGSLSSTQAADTCAAAGTVSATITGTLNRTQAKDSSSGTGAVLVSGSSSVTQAKNSMAAAGPASTIVRAGNNTADTYAGFQDTWINASNVTQNNGSDTSFNVDASTLLPLNGLMSWSGLSSLTGPVSVLSARIFIYGQGLGHSPPATEVFSLYQVKRPWTEGGATWNKYDATNNWSTPGALGSGTDIVATPVLAQTIPNAVAGYQAFVGAGLLPLVEGWINGTIPNDGLLFRRTDASNDGAFTSFYSQEGVSDGLKPYLEIEYIAVSSSTGTVADTQAANSTTTAGAVLVSGSSADTQAKDSSGAAGGVLVSGTVADTQAKNSLAAAGIANNNGVVADLQAANTSAVSGTVSGTAVISEPARTYHVTSENRAYVVTVQTRTYTVPLVSGVLPTVGQDRVYIVTAETRTRTPNAENRVLVATPENRVDTI